MYLLDTVVLSELRKRERDAGIVNWLRGKDADALFLSAITMGEVERVWLSRVMSPVNASVPSFAPSVTPASPKNRRRRSSSPGMPTAGCAASLNSPAGAVAERLEERRAIGLFGCGADPLVEKLGV